MNTQAQSYGNDDQYDDQYDEWILMDFRNHDIPHKKKKQGHAKGQGEELKILGTPASFDLVLSIWVFHDFPMGLGQTQVKINQS